MKTSLFRGALCGCLCLATVSAQTVIDNFEYATDDDLLTAWTPDGGATVTLSDSVAPQSTGQTSMRVEFNFPSTAWATLKVQGAPLANELSIATTQYVTFRLRGDPVFAGADFRNLYLYAYDADGNFGRWGGATPTTDDWQIVNYAAADIQQPWDSPALPDLNHIVRFSFFQYGSEAAIEAYTASIHIDDLTIRDAPLTEFPPPAAPRELIDDFEGYADDAALHAFYSYQSSPPATTTMAALATPAPQGDKALRLAIQFAPGQWPWGSVQSVAVAPFSFPTNAVVSLRLKGDPALAAVADAGTTYWLSFYDKAGQRINFSTPAEPVISSSWTTLQASLADFWGDTASIDLGNLVRWRILIEGWQGTAEQAAMSGVFEVDDIRVTIPPAAAPLLTIQREGNALKLGMERLVPGKLYDLRTTADFVQWSSASVIYATASTDSRTVEPSGPGAFYQLVEKPSP